MHGNESRAIRSQSGLEEEDPTRFHNKTSRKVSNIENDDVFIKSGLSFLNHAFNSFHIKTKAKGHRFKRQIQ